VAAFERHEVAYLVIGGEVARARGWPEQTEDVDVIPERSKENLLAHRRAMSQQSTASSGTRARALSTAIDGNIFGAGRR
jgi:hypothetical protein